MLDTVKLAGWRTVERQRAAACGLRPRHLQCKILAKKILTKKMQCRNIEMVIWSLDDIKTKFIYEMDQGGNMGNAWDTAKDGIMSEEDYPYEHKVFSNYHF